MCGQGKTSVEIVEATHIVAAKNGLSTLLRNKAYLGERIYNTTRRASLSEKKTHRLRNAPNEFVIIADSHPPIVSRDLFDQVQAVLDAKRPKISGRRKHSPNVYILSGLLFCKEHDCAYGGHTTGERMYYACGNRKKLGKKLSPCSLLKKEAIENFILDNLKENVITREAIKKGLEYIQAEDVKNHLEDDIEQKQVEGQIAKSSLELNRCYAAIKSGVNAEAIAEPVNELHERIYKLNKRLTEIQIERGKVLKIPDITEAMVDDIMEKVNAILETTDRQELKAALTHFVERIIIDGQDVTIEWNTFKKPTLRILPVIGDPGGI